MSTYANVLQSSPCGIAPEKSKKRRRTQEQNGLKKSKTDRVLEILRREPSLKNRDIAQMVGCHEQFVSQVKKQKVMGEQPPWFENHVSKVQEFEKSNFSLLDQTIAYTSNLSLDVTLRDITEKELGEHKLNISEITDETIAAKKEFLRRRLFLGACKDSFHGFLQVEPSMSEDDLKSLEEILNTRLPALLARKKHGAAAEYEKDFTPIFEYVQLAPLRPGQKREDNDTEQDRRMGDKKRSQAKLSALLGTAANRVAAAQDAVDKSTLNAGRKQQGTSKQNRRLIKELAVVKKEEELILDLIKFMRKHYHYIREVRNTISKLKDKTLIPFACCRCGR